MYSCARRVLYAGSNLVKLSDALEKLNSQLSQKTKVCTNTLHNRVSFKQANANNRKRI